MDVRSPPRVAGGDLELRLFPQPLGRGGRGQDPFGRLRWCDYLGLEVDGVFSSADDVDVDFGVDQFVNTEG